MGIADFFKKKKKEDEVKKDEVSEIKEAEVVQESRAERRAKKKEDKQEPEIKYGQDGKMDFNAMMSGLDTSGMSKMQKMGLKMFQKLPQHKQEEVLRQAMNPNEVKKHKDKILKQIDKMVEEGQIDKSQAAAVKSKMGLR